MTRSTVAVLFAGGGSGPTVPGAPTDVSAVAGDTEATVSFTPPVNTGGEPITSYTATSSPGGFTASGASSPLVVTGLTNGQAYTFTVTATNAVGTGSPSSASNTATPATVPGAPTIGTAVRGNAQASVAFTAPASDGGTAITGYTATSSPGGFTGSGASSPVVVTGLSNGTAYTFTVTATNAVGTGAASAASNSVTPATVPGAPTIGAATGGDTQASVAFTAPASNGGSTITGYTATSSPGGLTASGASSPLVVTGLTNGVAYTFTVTATNAVGTGAASAASNSVTPQPPPFAGAWARYDASNAGSISLNGSLVTQWNDLTANGRHLVQSNNALRPSSGTRTQNGLNVIDFPGGRYLIRASGVTTLSFAVLVVIIADSTNNGQGVVIFHNATNDDYDNTNCAQAIASSNTNLATDVFDGNNNLAMGGRAAGVYSLRKDGTAANSLVIVGRAGQGSGASASATSTANGTSTNLLVGARFFSGSIQTGTSNGAFDGAIGEIVIYNPAPSLAQLTADAAVLAAKWGY